MRLSKTLLLGCGSCLGIAAAPASAQSGSTVPVAQTGAEDALEEIVVTANKRTESVNDVPMSITAVTGEALADAGVVGVQDLGRVAPGFTFTKTHDSIPVLSIRGIGYYDNFIGATPAVSAYSDEVPLPYPVLTGGALLDLERVELLKGPQGTLFGQNSTGGAINFIAAKPRDIFEGGASLSFGRFNAIETTAYLTGPLGSGFKIRVAGRWEGGDDWQRSYTRQDELGEVDRGAGRMLLVYDGQATFRAQLAVETWHDKSDSQAPQLTGLLIALPGFQNPGLATGDPLGFFGPPSPLEQVYPNSPRQPRAADWSPGIDYSFDNRYWRTSLRLEYDVADAATLTSITAYQTLDYYARTDVDGTALQIGDFPSIGDIEAFFQELRASGDASGLKWTVGANYSEGQVDWTGPANFRDWSVPINNVVIYTDVADETIAAFGNVEVRVAEPLTLVAGARYTRNKQRLLGCPADSGDGLAAATLNFFRGTTNLRPGECYSLNDLDGSFEPEEADIRLKEDNLSWRLGVNYEPTRDVLIYANVTKGYKSGAFTLATFDVHSQALPATQESVMAYEAGLKYGARNFQINGAIFYYDYKDKQLLAPFFIENFGLLDKLQNIDKSRVVGFEWQASAVPIQGLNISVSGTYIDSKVKSSFLAANPLGGPDQIDLKGLQFPHTPRWQTSGDISYRFPVGGTLEAMVGSSITTRSSSLGRFGGEPTFQMPKYALLDLRAGIETVDGRYALEAFGRNVTNKYYRTNVASNADTIIAFAGMPATYGLRGTIRF